jgi:hypothetical protein
MAETIAEYGLPHPYNEPLLSEFSSRLSVSCVLLTSEDCYVILSAAKIKTLLSAVGSCNLSTVSFALEWAFQPKRSSNSF